MNEKEIKQKVFEHWENDNVESMYDKHLISLEIELISQLIQNDKEILDAGCGEGEGTLVYSKISGSNILGADYSPTRLKKAKERLSHQANVEFRQVDFLEKLPFDQKFDVIVSQRFLINLFNWKNQSETISKLISLLNPGGELIMLEGSKDGVNELNEVRSRFGLDPIPIPWHNEFFDDSQLETFIKEQSMTLKLKSGLGAYFLLTRGVRPYFDKELNWDAEYNQIASGLSSSEMSMISDRFSRLRLWHFKQQ